MNNIQSCCPMCNNLLTVKELYCDKCNISLKGEFAQNLFYSLTKEEQQFVFDFVINSGSLKDMAEKLDKSYPTVRNILDGIIEKLKMSGNKEKKLGNKKDIIMNLVENRQITIKAAEEIIKLLKL